MDTMLEDKRDMAENTKDNNSKYGNSVKNIAVSSKYNKANKLITALFMVTDIMDKDEPLRHKLRQIGTEILSDVYSNSNRVVLKVSEILSFLDIASTLGMISDMNKNILSKEFNLLKNSFGQMDSIWLENFIGKDAIGQEEYIPKIASYQTNLGVQKGSTLMKALSNVGVSHKREFSKPEVKERSEAFDIVKKERREEILNIIKSNKNSGIENGSTITDIRTGAKISFKGHLITNSSEKTLQRELASMVKDNVLKKSGEKRWSRYFI
jgi:hypothetical protein